MRHPSTSPDQAPLSTYLPTVTTRARTHTLPHGRRPYTTVHDNNNNNNNNPGPALGPLLLTKYASFTTPYPKTIPFSTRSHSHG